MVMTTPTRMRSQMEENLVPGMMGCVFHQVASLRGGRKGGSEGVREEVREGGGERRKKVVERN